MNTYVSTYEWVETLDLSPYTHSCVYGPSLEVPIKINTIEESLLDPLGTKSLDELLAKRAITSALIIVDDIARPTPQKEILASVLPIFERHGVHLENITLLIALGLHRPMTHQEMIDRYGENVVDRCKVLNHDPYDEENLTHIGTTLDGQPITVNSLVTKAQFIMGIGQIAPHRVVGFSGGAKIIVPGVSGKDIISHLHWLGWTTDSDKIFAIPKNRVRDEVNHIGEVAKLDFVINVIMEGLEVLHYYSGNHNKVFNQASKDILKAYSIPIPPSEVVVVEAYPYDLDMQQAAKAVCTAEMVMKKGGAVILVTTCPDGWHVDFRTLKKTGYLPYTKVVELVEGNKLDKLIGCHFAAFGRVLESGRIYVVSNHLEKEDVKAMNLIPAKSIQEALNQEVKRQGKDIT
ncbi:MAG: nickel-dependent lactate racemase, partial [Spirochaetia bacterium]|nr:nickel-dependent lactate racemase [Spirochaetia bacterium]